MTVGWVAGQAAVSRHGRLPSHDTAVGGARTRRWEQSGRTAGRASERACGASRRWGAGAQAEARWACGKDAAIRPLGPATRPGPCHDTAGDPTTIRRPCVRLGAPVRTWACLLGLLGARASGLVSRTGFRLGDIFESPFGLGS